MDRGEDSCGLKVIDANGQSLAYVYSSENPNDAFMRKVLTLDEARRIASNSPSCLAYSPNECLYAHRRWRFWRGGRRKCKHPRCRVYLVCSLAQRTTTQPPSQKVSGAAVVHRHVRACSGLLRFFLGVSEAYTNLQRRSPIFCGADLPR